MNPADKDQLAEVLRLHARWGEGGSGGRRANLTDANLARANLTDANLARANLARASLTGANLARASLTGANLARASLTGANLEGANLTGASLEGANLAMASLARSSLAWANLAWANLEGANLARANLTGANLARANLTGANLEGANLEGANLTGANLEGANLEGANLTGAKLPHFQIPQQGTLTVWKKLSCGVVAKLLVPAKARRTASLVGRKCRAEWVKVLEGEGVSQHDGATRYAPGEIVRPDRYDDDIRVECAPGIHFFLTREEAEEYWR